MKNDSILYAIAIMLVLGGIRVLFDGPVANVARISDSSESYISARKIKNMQRQNQTEMSELISRWKNNNLDIRLSEECQNKLFEIVGQSGRGLSESDMRLTLNVFSQYPVLFEPLFFEKTPSSRQTAALIRTVKLSASDNEIALVLPEGFFQFYQAVLRNARVPNLISKDECSLIEK